MIQGGGQLGIAVAESVAQPGDVVEDGGIRGIGARERAAADSKEFLERRSRPVR